MVRFSLLYLFEHTGGDIGYVLPKHHEHARSYWGPSELEV